ncbi:hypothetical protein A2U01_0043181, partial [Trifolium medium]|nr:hypothetical protein [Trifolium medium]
MLIKARSSSNSTASDSDVRAKVEHDALIFKFTRKYIQENAFHALEANPKIIWEEAKQKDLEQKAAQITKDEIDKEARHGIEHYSSVK